MRRLLFVVAAVVLVVGLTWAAVNQPLALVAAVSAACLVTYSYFMPKQRLVGWLVSLSIIVVAVFPIHLVPTALRYAELGMLALFAAITLLHRGLKPLKSWIVLLVLGYLAVTFAATQATGIEDAPFQMLVHAIVGIVFLVFGASLNEGERRSVTATVIFVGVAEALYALYEYVAKPAVLWASPVPEKWTWMETRLANEIMTGGLRSQGTFGHPLLLSFVMIVALGLALRFPFKWRLARPAVVGLLFVASVAAGSRSAALIMLGLALFAYGMSRFAWLRGLGLAAVLVMLVLSSSFLSSDIVSRFTESGSLTHRQGAIDAVPRLLSEQTQQAVWFGNGFHSTQYVFDRGLLQLDGFVAIDNQYVALLVTTGIFGVLVWLLLPVLTLSRADRTVKPAILGAFAVFLVFDIFEFPATWAVFMLLIGLAVASKREPQQAPQEAAPEVDLKRLPEWAVRNQEFVRSAAAQTPAASRRSPQAGRW